MPGSLVILYLGPWLYCAWAPGYTVPGLMVILYLGSWLYCAWAHGYSHYICMCMFIFLVLWYVMISVGNSAIVCVCVLNRLDALKAALSALEGMDKIRGLFDDGTVPRHIRMDLWKVI